MPFDISRNPVLPVYKTFKGWTCNFGMIKSVEELPDEMENYINYLEEELDVPIVIVSIGPDRSQTLKRKYIQV
jgi:adenylosuccinate synthase